MKRLVGVLVLENYLKFCIPNFIITRVPCNITCFICVIIKNGNTVTYQLLQSRKYSVCLKARDDL